MCAGARSKAERFGPCYLWLEEAVKAQVGSPRGREAIRS
jgi:hypothetical protein